MNGPLGEPEADDAELDAGAQEGDDDAAAAAGSAQGGIPIGGGRWNLGQFDPAERAAATAEAQVHPQADQAAVASGRILI